ncbi:MAG: tRNA-modifying protein YgfZ [Buchnera aphidicola (Periphyllus acericola)]|uniref:tRNA-modifying protein YgfZ n=1 Tax=Buchnera aphidicola TaxID=9 RepID=UPI0030CD6E37|nr:tRNA-modifying protein YgfZ [Buchnera aphidicola (Periphyllus acericola)]
MIPITEILPSFSFLKKLTIIKVSGKDTYRYLQNQITANMNLLKKNKYIFCGHCNDKGKVWSTLFFFKKNNNYFYILRNSVYLNQVKAMKKYSIFFDVKIKKYKKFFLFGISGVNAKKKLKKIFKILPKKKNPIIYLKENTLIWLKNLFERFLIIIPYKKLFSFKKKFEKAGFLKNNKQWLLIDIKENIPIIEKKTSLCFFPQEINLHKFENALSFKKGCYIGQENIAKIKYKKLNKRSLFILYCFYKQNIFSPGDFVYVKIKDNWIKKGILLSSVIVSKKIIYVQVVLNNLYKKKNIYKINNVFFKVFI